MLIMHVPWRDEVADLKPDGCESYEEAYEMLVEDRPAVKENIEMMRCGRAKMDEAMQWAKEMEEAARLAESAKTVEAPGDDDDEAPTDEEGRPLADGFDPNAGNL